MTTVARAGIALLVLAVGLAVTGTAGTTAVSADRAALVATGTDADSYLGVEPLDPTVPNGHQSAVPLLALSNQFPDDLDTVRVTILDSDERPPRLLTDEWDTALSVGETRTVTADVVCGGNGQFREEWTLSVVATGSDTEIRTTETVTVTCDRADAPPENRPGTASRGPVR
jgi:hypothetical protein